MNTRFRPAEPGARKTEFFEGFLKKMALPPPRGGLEIAAETSEGGAFFLGVFRGAEKSPDQPTPVRQGSK